MAVKCIFIYLFKLVAQVFLHQRANTPVGVRGRDRVLFKPGAVGVHKKVVAGLYAFVYIFDQHIVIGVYLILSLQAVSSNAPTAQAAIARTVFFFILMVLVCIKYNTAGVWKNRMLCFSVHRVFC
jgi:hypothetical protein